MRFRTLFRFLTGDRRAILEIASDSRSVWIGLAFVISAGLAREYDGVYLLAAPWHLFAPLGASLLASFLLYTLLYGLMLRRAPDRQPFWAGYRIFLSLFWMTAPLAWLYATPYERVLSAYDATWANLLTLALVSVWRVLLITRVVSVMTGVRFSSAIYPVLLFADVAAVAGTMVSPVPLTRFMGGIRHTPSDALLLDATNWVYLIGFPALFVLFIATLVARARCKPERTFSRVATTAPHKSRATVGFAVASILVWFAALPFTQPEQRLRWIVDDHLEHGQILEALGIMSGNPLDAFPPGFDPRPRLWAGQATPDIGDIMDAIVSTHQADWVRAIYVQKFQLAMDSRSISKMEGEDLARLAKVVDQLPEGPNLAAEIRRDIGNWLVRTPDSQSSDFRKLSGLLEIAKSAR